MKDNKTCTLVGLITDIIYLIALFFFVKIAKENPIFIVACIVVACVAAAVVGRCFRHLVKKGIFFGKIIGSFLAGVFAVGTIVVVFLALVWF